MGGVSPPPAIIGGASASPTIPLATSYSSGLFESSDVSAGGGVGIALGGNQYFNLNALKSSLGYKIPQAFALPQVSNVALGAAPVAVLVSLDDAYVYVLSAASLLVYQRNVVTGVVGSLPLQTYVVAGGSCTSMSLTFDGSQILVVSPAGNVTVLARNASTGQVSQIVGSPYAFFVYVMAVHPNGNFAYAVQQGTTLIGLYSRNALGQLGFIGASGIAETTTPHQNIIFSPDGLFMYLSGSAAGVVSQYSINPSTGVAVNLGNSPTIPGSSGNAQWLCMTPDGLNLYLLGCTNGVSAGLVGIFRRSQVTGYCVPNATSSFVVLGGSAGVVSGSINNAGTELVVTSTAGVLQPYVIAANGTLTAGVAVLAGTVPQDVAFSADGSGLVSVNSTSNNLLAYLTGSSLTYQLLNMIFDPAGGLNGSLFVNGQLYVGGLPVVPPGAGTVTTGFDGVQTIISSDTSLLRVIENGLTAAGTVYTLPGDFIMWGLSHNTGMTGTPGTSLSWAGADDSGACCALLFTEGQLLQAYYAPAPGVGVVPTFSASPKFSLNMNTGNITLTSVTSTSVTVNQLFMGSQIIATTSSLPTIASGFGTSPTILARNTMGFKVVVGTAPTGVGVLNMPAAFEGWICRCTDVTSNSTILVQQSADTTNSASFQAYGITTGLPVNFNAGDELNFMCVAY